MMTVIHVLPRTKNECNCSWHIIILVQNLNGKCIHCVSTFKRYRYKCICYLTGSHKAMCLLLIERTKKKVVVPMPTPTT